MKVAELTVEELSALVRHAVTDVLEQRDPDFGLKLRPGLEEQLRYQMEHPEEGTPLDVAMKELGIEL